MSELGPRTIAACFAASVAISATGAVLLGPDTMGWVALSAGTLAYVGAVILERIAPMSEVS